MSEIKPIKEAVIHKGFMTTKEIIDKFGVSRANALEVMKKLGRTLDFTYIPGSVEMKRSSVLKYTPSKIESLVKKTVTLFSEMKTDTLTAEEIMEKIHLDFKPVLELMKKIAADYPEHFKIDEPLSSNNIKESDVFLIYSPTNE